MADVSSTFGSLSSTESNSANGPSGSSVIGAGLDENLRMYAAHMAAWRDQTAWGILTLTSVAGSGNSITATVATAGSVTFGPTSLSNGMKFLLFPSANNTGPTNIAITSPNGGSSLGTKNIFAGNSTLVGGELHSAVPSVIAYDGTNFQLMGPTFKQQTRQVLTSGSSATYTTPAGVTRLFVRAVGGGGGGGAANGGGAGGNGGTTSFSGGSVTISCGGGGGGGNSNTTGGSASVPTGGDLNMWGNPGMNGPNVANGGSHSGAGGPWGGAGLGVAGGVSGNPGQSNSGGGGSGGGGNGGTAAGGAGASGSYSEKLITAPASSYTYTIGAAGTAGAAGGAAGGAGGSGVIIVDEFYN